MTILEQVFGEQRDLISYTCDMIRQCYRSQKPAETSLTNITAQDMTVEGRKNKAVVTLCQDEADEALDSRRVIHLQTVQAQTFPSLLVMPLRLLSRANRNFQT